MIAKGKYKAKATEGVYGTAKNKGTTFVRVSFQVVDGPEAGNYVTWDGYFTENTNERTIESLRHCGCTFPGNDITNLEGLTTNDVQVVVEHESYTIKEGENAGQEKTVARVAWVNSLGTYGVPEDQRLDDAGKKSFAARMKGLLMATGKKSASPNRPASGNGAAPSRGGPPAGGGYDNDEIPF